MMEFVNFTKHKRTIAKELSFILSVMSSLLKREITNYSDLQANLEQDQIGSIYPFEIRPNSYWEKKTEMIKEVNS